MKSKSVVIMQVVLLLLTGCDNPAVSLGDDEVDPLIGTLRNAGGTNLLTLNEDGTTETPDFKGS